MVTDVCQKVYGFPDVPSGMTFCTTKKDPSFIMFCMMMLMFMMMMMEEESSGRNRNNHNIILK